MKAIVFLLVVIVGILAATARVGKHVERQADQIAPHYVEYSEGAYAQARTKGRAVLFFWAPWCSTCSVLDDELQKRSGELPDDVTILKVNFDTEKELKRQYAIVQQHTEVLVDKEGKEIEKWVGGNVDLLKQKLGVQNNQAGESTGRVVINKNVSLANDFTGAKVKPTDLVDGCLGGKDCILSIDNPTFDAAARVTWLADVDVVFAIEYKEVTRAYPQRILNWHEIVNDAVGGDPIAITFCPLCGSALAFIRKVDGVTTELGVSGKLHNSDLVMYDRYEGNLWQQITGEAIVGPAARRNETLKQIPIVTTTWGEWKKEHPDTDVLSRRTGYDRNYDAYPYGTYEQDDELYFGVKNLNKKLQIKTVVYGVELGGASKAYPEDVFSRQTVIEDTLAGTPIRIERVGDGTIMVTNGKTNEEIIPIRLFWFAWAAFHPDTLVYEGR